MRIVEGFARFCNAMYLGMMFEKMFYSELMCYDKVLITLNIITLVVWILNDIKRTKMGV